MEQECKDCEHVDNPENVEPCKSCEWNELEKTFSNFTPKKDINQLLRERIEASKTEGVGQLYGFSTYTTPPLEDAVKRPSHYMLKPGLEVRDVLTILVNKIREGSQIPFWKEAPMFESDYVQAMQYGMRFMDKGGKQDLEKMRWYLDKLIEAYE